MRREAGTKDVRLHDLRHTRASHAVMNGVPVPLVSRLLGHSNVRMTLRYAHLEDRDIEQAAERVRQAVAELMRLTTQLPPLDTSSLAEHIHCLAHERLLASGLPEALRNDRRVINACLGVR